MDRLGGIPVLIACALLMAGGSSAQSFSFVAPLQLDVGEQPGAMAVADFNGDGVNDLAVVIDTAPPVASQGVAIMLGLGDGFGAPQVVFRGPAAVMSVAAADFNGDGVADLAVVSNAPFSGPGSVVILLGNGDGTFGEPSSFAAGTSSPSRGLAVGDFNGDDNLDVVVTNMGSSNSLSVLLGNGDGTFQPANVVDLGVSPFLPWSVAVADFNEDGRLDVVVGLHSGSLFISVLLGDGEGGFHPPMTYETGIEAQAVAVADFNRDGHSDVAVAFKGSFFPPQPGGVSVLLGYGDGTFQPASNYEAGSEPVWLAVGDFDNDGAADLVVANYTSQDVSILFGNGDGTFQTQLTLDAGSTPQYVVTGDFNGDGISDFAVTDFLGADVAVVLSNGDRSFHARPSLLRGNPTWASVAGDFDGDGISDLAVTNNIIPGAIDVLLSRGDGTFAGPIRTSLPSCAGECGPVALAAADFDGDGKLDIAVAEANVGVIILLGSGNGAFRIGQTVPVGRLGFNSASLAISDFNGDGIADWAISVEGDNRVMVALGNGNATFQPPRGFAVGSHPQAIAVADFNRDGFADVVVTNLFSDSFSLLLGRGDGTFEPALNQDTETGSPAIAVGDFNGDTFPDVVVTRGQGGVGGDRHNSAVLFLGNGDGTFQPPSRFPGGIYNPTQLAVADFDGDGNEDLVIADGLANSLTVLLGDGQGRFQSAITFGAGNNPNSIAIGDFNADGKPDLATANRLTDVGIYSISVLINDTPWAKLQAAALNEAGEGASLSDASHAPARVLPPLLRRR